MVNGSIKMRKTGQEAPIVIRENILHAILSAGVGKVKFHLEFGTWLANSAFGSPPLTRCGMLNLRGNVYGTEYVYPNHGTYGQGNLVECAEFIFGSIAIICSPWVVSW